MSTDVAIVGIGLHPFGRHPGVSAMDMGVIAVRRALSDAGIEWRDVQIAYGGSLAVMHPDTMSKHLGLTGIPFANIFNGCATGGNCLINAANAIKECHNDSHKSYSKLIYDTGECLDGEVCTEYTINNNLDALALRLTHRRNKAI